MIRLQIVTLVYYRTKPKHDQFAPIETRSREAVCIRKAPNAYRFAIRDL
jgi:hypothetical protein